MGNDTALAVLSDQPLLLFRYFKQQFAQVTNPPIDPIREALVMSLVTHLGAEGSLLDEVHGRPTIRLEHPILTDGQLGQLLSSAHPQLRAAQVDMLFDAVAAAPGEALAAGLDAMCSVVLAAVADGATIVVLGDRHVSPLRAPIPSLLACAAAHHALIRAGKRMRCSIVLESGEARQVTDIALLLGFGAGAVNPYLALSVANRVAGERGTASYIKAVDKGLRRILAKVGICTMSSYRGAQIFEAIGISQSLVERYFPGIASRVSGVGLDEIAARRSHGTAKRMLLRTRHAYGRDGRLQVDRLWRAPRVVARRPRHAAPRDTRRRPGRIRRVRSRGERCRAHTPPRAGSRPRGSCCSAARGRAGRGDRPAVRHGRDVVRQHQQRGPRDARRRDEPNRWQSNRVKAAKTPSATRPTANGDSRRSAIKQVASARFGVSAHYLVNADEIQIKIAQGAKPGEGGQLPGDKVDGIIARVRHSTPGVTLISPPPHHDIYSIEDLAQLISTSSA